MRRRGFFNDRRGVAAVEFALIFAFFLLPLFIGLIEIVTLYRAQEKLNAFVINLAMMVSVETPLPASNNIFTLPATGTSASSLQDACNGAVAGFAPYPANGLTVQIASVTLEAGPGGLPKPNTSTSFVYYSGGKVYDQWEQDFTVSAGSCASSTTNAIGTTSNTSYTGGPAINLATSNPPSTAGGGSGGLVQSPCDNALIVKAQIPYPGLLGLILTNRITLTQSAYMRWRYASTETELQCPTCTVSINNTANLAASGAARYQSCNANNTSATN
ncbi:TadE/TadG family type IV pilus assembly protein [Acidocella facilis]|uniref:TadE/TadG family type IV pilus assembly protein n=1 Tax=Acidocella facilis TaxID=525 RepID=UPI001F1F1001|nr:hypothetical protein [Acidocella facilis]